MEFDPTVQPASAKIEGKRNYMLFLLYRWQVGSDFPSFLQSFGESKTRLGWNGGSS